MKTYLLTFAINQNQWEPVNSKLNKVHKVMGYYNYFTLNNVYSDTKTKKLHYTLKWYISKKSSDIDNIKENKPVIRAIPLIISTIILATIILLIFGISYLGIKELKENPDTKKILDNTYITFIIIAVIILLIFLIKYDKKLKDIF